MRNLTTTLCLTVTVLLGSVVCISTTSASEFVQSRFGKVTLNLPYPNELCLLGHSQNERILRGHQSSGQRGVGNKLLAMWIDCGSQEILQGGGEAQLHEWVIIVGTLTGKPKREQVYPRLSPDRYLKDVMKQYGKLPLNKLMDKTNKFLERANSLYLGDSNAISIAEPINLGVVAVTDSVHTGMIFNVKTKTENYPTLVIMSTSLIMGIPVHHYFYKRYKSKKTFEKLLPKAKYYTAKIIHAN